MTTISNRQIKEISRPDVSRIGFEYDDIGRVARVIPPSGEISYTYSDTTESLFINDSSKACSYILTELLFYF